MKIAVIAAVTSFALAFACVAFTGAAHAGAAYEIVVNPKNDASSLDRKFVEDAFLKKISRWPDDTALKPVDLSGSAPARRVFSDEVLHRSVEAVKGYWQQRIFSGRDVPPPELDSDDEVVDYVLKYDGAVGYVSGGASLRGAKVVGVR